MSISIDTLIEEKTLLQKDFDEVSKKIRQVEQEVIQMRNNLNALNGAIQQTNKLIAKAQEKKGKK
jgi:septal ring factor EnvC (AmiA/AmiB activator)|tara:strand:- start:92 stop:286 length:195 start_codon:yes stop_codon:yes gene_type:complete